MSDRPWAGRRLHLIGLGGAGMSGYARVATRLGARVSGSDRAEGPALAGLREIGVEVHVGHDAANVPAGGGVEVFHSTAILVIGAILLGAVTARADVPQGHAHASAAASSSAAIR